MSQPTPGQNVTINRPRHGIPGLGNVELIAQPAYNFQYLGQTYTASWDGRQNSWVVSWCRETDGQPFIMAVRDTLEQAVSDAMDDVDALARHLPQP